jgi:predicted nucleotidyltransferase
MSSSPAVGGFAALFASPTLVSLLRQFLTRPDTDFYQRELAGLTDSRLAQVQRDLLRLEGAGLVARRRHGNRVYYRACSGHPAFADLQAVFAKTIGVAEVLRRPLLALGEQIDVAFVYGSVAAGHELATSDIDVLVVSGHDPRELATVLAEAGEQLGREVNVVVYSADELRSRIAAGSTFLADVLDGPRIWLLGDDAGLRDLRPDGEPIGG